MQLADQPGLKVNAGVDLHIENGILTYLHSAHANMPHLKQIADSFGPPEYIEAVLAIGPDSGYYIPEAYYPKLGLAFKISPNRNDTGYIKQNMEIRSIEYFAPGDLLSYLTTKYSCGSRMKSMQPSMHKLKSPNMFGRGPDLVESQ